ncbi:hypothetical protein N1851_022793 [Merluccius polli]|uniref:DDE Tnp4 domain-containing protein n=1 Tax=Merluccius polli TaxID=89951 RepID=A0AA47MHA4_MERPO|nr:hypothetical protein N1851_022793 [Merluccius polli]
MFGNTTIFSNRENASLQCRRFRNIATINEDVFVNRKKVHSINTQIAFDATFNILDVVAKWPAGSTRDPRILMESGLRREAPCTSWVSCWVTVAVPARRLDTLSQSTTGSTVKV